MNPASLAILSGSFTAKIPCRNCSGQGYIAGVKQFSQREGRYIETSVSCHECDNRPQQRRYTEEEVSISALLSHLAAGLESETARLQAQKKAFDEAREAALQESLAKKN